MQTLIRAQRTGGGSGASVTLKASRGGDLRVAQFLPKYAMLSAAGKLYGFDTSPGTAAVPVVDAPTTSPEWAIYNANSSGGPSLVLIAVTAWMSEGIAGLGLCIMVASAKGQQTVVSANATSCVVSCLDGTSKVPNAYIASNPTLLGGAPSWQVMEASDQIGSDGVGEGIVAWCDGLFIAPPGGLLCAEVVAETGTGAKYDLSFIVAEVQLDTA